VFEILVTTLMQAIGFFIFGVFWLVSSPVYVAAEFCDWQDSHVNKLLKRLF